jgi:hypothetical protein
MLRISLSTLALRLSWSWKSKTFEATDCTSWSVGHTEALGILKDHGWYACSQLKLANHTFPCFTASSKSGHPPPLSLDFSFGLWSEFFLQLIWVAEINCNNNSWASRQKDLWFQLSSCRLGSPARCPLIFQFRCYQGEEWLNFLECRPFS